MSGTDGLAEFLAARLDELEAAAEAAANAESGATWVTGPTEDDDKRSIRTPPPGSYWVADQIETATADHIAANDPAAVLADIAADRAILWKYQIGNALEAGKYKLGYCEALEEVIKIRAARFASHPGYKPEWRPE